MYSLYQESVGVPGQMQKSVHMKELGVPATAVPTITPFFTVYLATPPFWVQPVKSLPLKSAIAPLSAAVSERGKSDTMAKRINCFIGASLAAADGSGKVGEAEFSGEGAKT